MSPGILLRPGAMALADWRAIYFGAPVALDEGCRAAVEAGAATIDAILAKHEPVYGINTGFGKLAATRIAGRRPRAAAAQPRAVARRRRRRAAARRRSCG